MDEMNREDRELEEIFSGEEKPLHPDTVHITLGQGGSKKETTKAEKSAHTPTHDFRDGKWEPVKEPNWMDTLKSCAKWALLFGGLSCLIFYWNEAGLMASSIAIPSMCLCTAMAGFGVGKSCVKGER